MIADTAEHVLQMEQVFDHTRCDTRSLKKKKAKGVYSANLLSIIYRYKGLSIKFERHK